MDDAMDPTNAALAAIPKSPVYKVSHDGNGLQICFVTTLRAAVNHYKQGGSALIDPKIKKLVTAFRFSPKVVQLNQDLENRKHIHQLIDSLTNVYRGVKKVIFEMNIDVNPIGLLLKTCPALEDLLFDGSQVNRIHRHQFNEAPETLLPLGHKIQSVTCKNVSLSHCLRLIQLLNKTKDEEVEPVYKIVDPVIKEADLPELQNLANAFLNDTWDKSIQFDMIAMGKKMARTHQPKRRALSDQVQRMLAPLYPHIVVVAARNVASMSEEEIRATIIKEGPTPLFEVMRDFEMHEAIRLAPVEAVRILSSGRLPAGKGLEDKKLPPTPLEASLSVWAPEPEKEQQLMKNFKATAALPPAKASAATAKQIENQQKKRSASGKKKQMSSRKKMKKSED